MKIEHSIKRNINKKRITPQVVKAFRKYSISEDISSVLKNLKTGKDYAQNQRALRCLEVVIKGVELGLLENAIELKVKNIMQELMAKTTEVINDVKQHLNTQTKFDKAIYSIDLTKLFDTEDSHLFYLIQEAFDEYLYLAEKPLVACYYTNQVVLYGWHRETYFDHKYAQDTINALCEDAAKMMDVEKDLQQKWKNQKHHWVNLYPENDEERAQIAMCLTLMKKRWFHLRNDNGTRYISFF